MRAKRFIGIGWNNKARALKDGFLCLSERSMISVLCSGRYASIRKSIFASEESRDKAIPHETKQPLLSFVQRKRTFEKQGMESIHLNAMLGQCKELLAPVQFSFH